MMSMNEEAGSRLHRCGPSAITRILRRYPPRQLPQGLVQPYFLCVFEFHFATSLLVLWRNLEACSIEWRISVPPPAIGSRRVGMQEVGKQVSIYPLPLLLATLIMR